MDNMAFESWLEKKSQSILAKVEKAPITEVEIAILCLHNVNQRMEFGFEQIDKKFDRVDKQFEQIDKHFELVDKKFDRVYDTLKWQTGLMMVMFAGIYIKLFLG